MRASYRFQENKKRLMESSSSVSVDFCTPTRIEFSPTSSIASFASPPSACRSSRRCKQQKLNRDFNLDSSDAEEDEELGDIE
jgi:hypothetical protein